MTPTPIPEVDYDAIIQSVYPGLQGNNSPNLKMLINATIKAYNLLASQQEVRFVRAEDRKPPFRKEVHIRYWDRNDAKPTYTAGWLHENGFWTIYSCGHTRSHEKIEWLEWLEDPIPVTQSPI